MQTHLPVNEVFSGRLLHVLLQQRAMWGSYYQKTPIEPQALVLSANLPLAVLCAPSETPAAVETSGQEGLTGAAVHMRCSWLVETTSTTSH
jgi:hypothetical protein